LARDESKGFLTVVPRLPLSPHDQHGLVRRLSQAAVPVLLARPVCEQAGHLGVEGLDHQIRDPALLFRIRAVKVADLRFVVVVPLCFVGGRLHERRMV
jgi:hypothetical protein